MKFPEDWQLTVRVFDKSGMFSIGENLIGETTIDLENRYYGDYQNVTKTALGIHYQKVLSEKRMI